MTPKQQRFVAEYLIDFNATQAAIRAGYSKNSASQIGEQNLRKLEIAEAIAERQAALAEKHDITLDTITTMLEEDRELARSLNQTGAAVTATMGLAKLHGLVVDKQQVTLNPFADFIESVGDKSQRVPKASGQANGHGRTGGA